MGIQAMFFDMGGTIETFGYTRSLRLGQTAGLQARLSAAGIELGLDDERLCDLVCDGLQRYHQWSLESLQELPPARVWRDYILAGRRLDQAALAAHAEDLMCYLETHYFERQMRPEIPAVLEALHAMGLKLGLISNVNSRGQVPHNLLKYGIQGYFDPVVLSSEYGRRKPDPAIFHYAARLAGVPASRCAYVGDRVARDIEGARRAGFGLAVQIRHFFEHGENDEGPAPDAIIDSMTELPAILRSRSVAEKQPADGIRAVLFDAGDILYHRPDRLERLRRFLCEAGLDPDQDHRQAEEMLIQQAYRGELDQAGYHEALLRLYGVSQPKLMEQGRQILGEADENVEFFEGVRSTLVSLKQTGYLLGIVTDTANPVYRKLRWFERGGFGHVWDSIISSNELGTRKPDPRIYRAALEQLGLSPAQAVFVGHKASELDGARAVGMVTISFNADPDASADFCIDHFADLLRLPILSGEAQL